MRDIAYQRLFRPWTTVKSQTSVALGHLRRALPLFAEQAGQYADANAAVATAGRRRARRTAVVAALALVPLALGLAVYATLGPAKVPPPLTGSPSPTPSPRPSLVAPLGSPALPTSVPAAGAVLPDLPKDRGVGPASLLRTSYARGVMTVQIAATSGWYRLLITNDENDVPSLWLSPDGRWLTWTEPDGRTVLRDLTGTSQRRLAGRPSPGPVPVTGSSSMFRTRRSPTGCGSFRWPAARSARWTATAGGATSRACSTPARCCAAPTTNPARPRFRCR
ncbi:hypothetical protein ACFQZ4_37765 [Catellatospora coxensis]